MKRKQVKIKQYSPFQDRRSLRRSKLLRAGAVVLGLCVLFGAGWWIAQTGLGGRGDLPEVVIPDAVSIPPASIADEGPTLADIDENELPTGPAVTAQGSWAAVRHSEITPDNLDDLLEGFQALGVTHVLVTLKDASGRLYYESAQSAAAGAYEDDGFDPAAVAVAIREAGMVPAARISAYEDSIAPYNQRSMAIQLAGGNNYLWLNNSQANGGVPWLNPYSEEAQSYISAIIGEVMDLGYQAIVVTGLQFPSGYGLEQANLAATATAGVTEKNEQLQKTALEWQAQVQAAGGSCLFSYAAPTLLGQESQLTGSTPLGFGVAHIVAEVGDDAEAEAVVREAASSGLASLVLRGGEYDGDIGGTAISLFVYDQ